MCVHIYAHTYTLTCEHTYLPLTSDLTWAAGVFASEVCRCGGFVPGRRVILWAGVGMAPMSQPLGALVPWMRHYPVP